MIDAGGFVPTDGDSVRFASLDGFEVVVIQPPDDKQGNGDTISGIVLPAARLDPARLARVLRALRELARRAARSAREMRRRLDEIEPPPEGQKPLKGRRRRGVNPSIRDAIARLIAGDGDALLALSALGYDP